MIDILINTNTFPLILSGCFALVFLIQLLFYVVIFWRLGRYRHAEPGNQHTGVTVVICAHNEHHHLKETLPLILEQDYPNYEVLVVNHASDDDTPYLLTSLEEQYPHLSTIYVPDNLNFFSGKKFPLSIGIKSAKHKLILLTDADCRPTSRNWIRLMQSAYKSKTEIVLGYGPYMRNKGLLNKLIRFDTAHISVQYLSYALAGIPYMGVGRNLSYLKDLFYKNQGFISHYRVRSGDDDLFINRVARRRNTSVMVLPESHTISEPKTTFGSWVTQKRRHLSTSHMYKLRHKILLGIYSFSLLAFYAMFILLLALNWSVIPVLSLFFIRLLTQYLIFASCFRQLNEKDLTPFVPIYEIMMLLLNIGIYTSNIVRKPTRWK